MKTTTAALAAAFLALVSAVVATGSGGPQVSPGFAGYEGVVDRAKGVRYVTIWSERATHVLAIRLAGGRLLRTAQLPPGDLGIPVVAYDGTAGGLSGDGRRLVLASYPQLPRAASKTHFAVLDTRSLRTRRLVVLDGSWSFDAVSPDGSILYLTHHLRVGLHPRYRVRTFDLTTGRLGAALVDRLEGERDMGGEPVARAASRNGRWAYTLYARRGHEPFVHALDTERREAFCIDLPLEMTYDRQRTLRLGLRERSDRLSVRLARKTLANVDTRSWKVTRER
jgi:hypothetical protein